MRGRLRDLLRVEQVVEQVEREEAELGLGG
jgi:hypothetical protein